MYITKMIIVVFICDCRRSQQHLHHKDEKVLDDGEQF